MSYAEIADKYGMDLFQAHRFARAWGRPELIHMTRLDRYRELQHLGLMAEVIELVGRDALSGALVMAQEMSPYRGDPALN